MLVIRQHPNPPAGGKDEDIVCTPRNRGECDERTGVN